MKIVIQALISSIAIHLVYFAGVVLVGYVKTRNYKPDMTNWDKAETLPNKVVFGTINAPLLYLFTFIGLTAICCILIFSYNKLLK